MPQVSLLGTPRLIRLNRIHQTRRADGLLSTRLLRRLFARTMQTLLGGCMARTAENGTDNGDQPSQVEASSTTGQSHRQLLLSSLPANDSLACRSPTHY